VLARLGSRVDLIVGVNLTVDFDLRVNFHLRVGVNLTVDFDLIVDFDLRPGLI